MHRSRGAPPGNKLAELPRIMAMIRSALSRFNVAASPGLRVAFHALPARVSLARAAPFVAVVAAAVVVAAVAAVAGSGVVGDRVT